MNQSGGDHTVGIWAFGHYTGGKTEMPIGHLGIWAEFRDFIFCPILPNKIGHLGINWGQKRNAHWAFGHLGIFSTIFRKINYFTSIR